MGWEVGKELKSKLSFPKFLQTALVEVNCLVASTFLMLATGYSHPALEGLY